MIWWQWIVLGVLLLGAEMLFDAEFFLVFLGVAVSDGEKDARAFADEMGVTYPLGLDPTGGKILIDYSAVMMPATFVIDRLGYEAKKYYLVSGPALRAALIDQLDTQ